MKRFFLLGLCIFTLAGCSSPTTSRPVATDMPSQVVISSSTNAPDATATSTSQPTSTATPFPSQSQSQQIGNLTLNEYPLISDQADLGNDCGLQGEIVSPIYEKIAQERAAVVDPFPTLTEINAIIQNFGYHLAGEAPPYKLYQGDVVLREISSLPASNRFSANQSKTDFFWAIHDTEYEGWLIHGKTIDTQYAFSSNFFVLPRFIGNDWVALQNNSGSEYPDQHLQALINDRVIYSQALDEENAVVTDCPVERIQIWNDHWILDMEEQVIMDGEPLDKKFGHTAVFEWLLLDDRPLYFFHDYERYGLVYDGEPLPVDYDEIKHDCISVNNAMGCILPIQRNNNAVGFFARRDGMWYYVEVRLSKAPAP